MNCADLEILLCDYVDGTLAADGRSELERHLAECANCAEMARDVAAAVGFIGRAADVEAPPELLTRILFNLPSAHHARAAQPGILRKFADRWLQPILQPRNAMGLAMTILSFSLLGRWAGISPRQLTLDDLRPTKVWQAIDDKAYRAWQRTEKFYQNLRFVYEIQTQLREWKQKEQELRGRVAGEGRSAGEQRAAGEERPAASRNGRQDAAAAPQSPGSNGSQK